MIDYISATKYQCKDSVFLGHCKPYASVLNNAGWETYYLDGCEKMQVQYKPEVGLRVQGSLPYFYKGHNFGFCTEELVQSIDFIDNLLGGVGLWGAIVSVYEYGAIMPVELKPKDYIANHYASTEARLKQVVNEKYGGNFTYWHNAEEDLKLYDAGANILMKQGMKRREIIEDAGWNPQEYYLKFEARNLKPSLEGGRGLPLEALQNQSYINNLKQNLMEQYHLLCPSRSIIMPTDKKNLSSLDAVLITLAEQSGLPLDQVKKMVYHTINNADCLTKADRDSRKAQIRKAFDKLAESPESRYDLTKKLQEALDNER